MVGARLGHFLDRPLASLIRNIPLSPNSITLTGFIITAIAAFVIPHNLKLGGMLILIGALFDMLDGIVARVNNRVTKFGAFLDS
ncbi:MAG: CDP-alcohol phosphatidyltransferase family protein, partial [Nitrospirae bacterium]